MTLYAKWEFKPNTLIVTFESQGGSEVPSKTVVFNETIEQPKDPNMGNATSTTFDGWYKNKSYNGKKFDFSTKIKENMTLYAKWIVDAGDFADKNVTYGTIYYAGRVWLDRNLGATRLASNVDDMYFSVCGNYYQWGRGNDGHQKYNSTTSPTKIVWNATSNKFIINHDTWISGGNTDPGPWVKGNNNPCPDGFRVPKRAEFESLITAIGAKEDEHLEAYFDALKMVQCGYRAKNNDYNWIGGYYWCYDDPNVNFYFIYCDTYIARTIQKGSIGSPVRCIKE